MEGKLREFTSRLYHEGVEKANTEARSILDNASKEAATLVANARVEAEKLLQKAKDEAVQLKAKILTEIKMAGEQSIAAVRQELINILAFSALKTSIKTALQDVSLLHSIIKELVAKWDKDSQPDLNVVLSEKMKDDFSEFFKAQSSAFLSKGVELRFESRMEGGFRFEPKDGSFILSFTDKDFNQFFGSFLKSRSKEIFSLAEKV